MLYLSVMSSASESDRSVNESVGQSLAESEIVRLRSVFDLHPEVKQGIVFGSLISGKVHPGSDLDIAVVWNGPVDPDKKLKLIKDLARTSGRPVDLVEIADCHGLLLKEILTKGVRLLPDDPLELFSLNKRLVYEEEDFMPMIRRVKKERVAAFANGH